MGKETKLRASVRKTHASGGLITQVDTNTEEICRASGFTTLASNTIFGAWRRRNLARLATIPRDHLKDIERACTDALSTADARVVDLDGVGHEPLTEQVTSKQRTGASRP